MTFPATTGCILCIICSTLPALSTCPRTHGCETLGTALPYVLALAPDMAYSEKDLVGQHHPMSTLRTPSS